MGRPTIIYALLDCVGTIRYVGKSLWLSKRLSSHRLALPWCAGHLVLEVVPAGEDWKPAERRHIERWNQWGDLVNVRNGGAGGETRSPETRAKMSVAARARVARAKAAAAGHLRVA